MLKKFKSFAIVAAAVVSATFTLGAQAAPQALALLSTEGDVRLACNGAECAATFSSYCLQNERPSPPGGTAYRLAGREGFAVTALDRHGQTITLAALDTLKLTAARTQVAVRISIERSELDKLGLKQISVNIGNEVTLLPVPLPGDKTPFTASEIALVTDTLRKAGSRLVDLGEGRTETVRWLSKLANSLPYGDLDAPLAGKELMRQASASLAAAKMSGEARSLAAVELRGCGKDLQLQIYPSLRRCLESTHDAYLWDLNANYWQAIHTGS
ncbi:MAG: hypothetical protein HOA08_21975 [Rhodospirillaceae bacterium]|jgi:hypothetical protein|nr:hypothetical protein [Rhodospirillaceae bacterium]MBT3491557.1 hypothetical protein [Rhodospirillaceae bacterium]MBT3780667.1 hypothetical protein [Rhodospirillaceae bacterium]MBT3976095.1 hypothetical protein [Rhodospirillaceae bacterium]MBT4170440.1 hypothetical protein [Rhodospirillaceae bacterium]